MSDEDPHKRMRRFGELCGYFYGRRFFGLETIMSDRDSGHMLLELQEARAEIDRLRDLLRWRCAKKEPPPPTVKGKWYWVDWEIGGKRWQEAALWQGTETLDDGGQCKWDKEGVRYWMPEPPLPENQNPLFSRKSIAMYKCKCGFTKNSDEACLNCGHLPGGD